MKKGAQRLFIAINLPNDIKKKIAEEVEKIRYEFSGDIRFSNPEDWYITLVFLGDQSRELIADIIDAAENTANNFPAPTVHLESLTYGPLGRTPRMVWINGSASVSKTLSEIKNSLEDNLANAGVKFKQEFRGFKAHVTLAKFNAATRQDLPVIEKKIDWKFTAASVDLMESHLSKNEAPYEKLAGADFL
ncbi:MAG: RNA 2',3'-cyclic phosphodiesterase [bacterium]|nr:RNA 2',3'-cyclic phosphodiesterase [bacterium]